MTYFGVPEMRQPRFQAMSLTVMRAAIHKSRRPSPSGRQQAAAVYAAKDGFEPIPADGDRLVAAESRSPKSPSARAAWRDQRKFGSGRKTLKYLLTTGHSPALRRRRKVGWKRQGLGDEPSDRQVPIQTAG